MTTGLVFHVQRYSLQDGPGIRTTVFLKGCPAACWWCHNPESQKARPEILYFEARCIGCGQCVEACPLGDPVTARDGAAAAARCELCGACVEACPAAARRLAGRVMSVDEVLADIRRDRLFYDESGGGVTFSGGEPLQQPEFLTALLRACRAEELHTTVDTSGHAPWESLEAVLPLTDLFLFDLKVMDEDRHRALTGVSNRLVLDNLRKLGLLHQAIHVRVPVIPGCNDDRDNIEATARFARGIPGVRQVDLLPYHRTGLQKFARVGRDYRLVEVEPPSNEHMENLAASFRSFGLAVTLGGHFGERAHGATQT